MAFKPLTNKKLGVYVTDPKDFEKYLKDSGIGYVDYGDYVHVYGMHRYIHKSFQDRIHHRSAYRTGYRRELTEEEIKTYLSKKINVEFYQWFLDWEQGFINEHGKDLEKINKECWKLYRKRNPFFLDEAGDIGTRSSITEYRLHTLQGRYQHFHLTKESYNTHVVAGYFMPSDEEKHLLTQHYNGDSLLAIIQYDYEECQEHPGEWYRVGGTCRECAKVYKLMDYSENPLKHLEFHTGKGSIHFGVELEVDTHRNKLPEVMKKLKGFAICKRDGSIEGFEVVTAPATFDVHVDKFKDFPWDSQTITHKDGMHVHIDRKKLNDTQIGKMFSFLYNKDNHTLINKIAGRDVQNNHYCSNNSERNLLSHLEENTSSERLVRKTNDSHGTALNVTSKGTVEVRIFQSPSTYEGFLSNLEFVKALVDYTSPGIVSLQGAKDQENFLNFINDRKTYPNLCNTVFGKRSIPTKGTDNQYYLAA